MSAMKLLIGNKFLLLPWPANLPVLLITFGYVLLFVSVVN